MPDQLNCQYCHKALITVEPGRLITHGPTSIRTEHERQAWVECPACGRETRIEPERLGVRLG